MQHSGRTITDLEASVTNAMPGFVTYEECEAEVKTYIAERCPDLGKKLGLGAALTDFMVIFAANVAWKCAAEATRRALKIPLPPS